ncbi:MAG: hypothetical protein JOY93_02175 [Acidobacteriales bacterium]|nr:hypothetical protein [Terriglobales bacterium]
MSSPGVVNLDLSAPPIVRLMERRSLIIGVIFAVIAIVGAFLRTDEFFHAYLLGFMLWLGVALGSMAILMIRHLTGGGWGVVIRRLQGAAMRTLPLLALLFVPIPFGRRFLYIWARPLDSIPDAHLRQHLAEITRSYLSVQGFIIRAVIYFAIWIGLSFFLSKWSAQHDQPPMRDTSARAKALSGPGLVLYAFTISFAAIDWVMSIDPSWISTIYGLIILIGEVLSAMCFAVVIERILVDYKPMSELLKPDFVHDHGKWMLTFLMLWAYFSFSQWLIIWAGNLPEEITWYIRRLYGGWGSIGLMLVVFHFVVPFVLLLSRPFKRNIRKLVWLATGLMIMRFVDLFWIIEPNFSPTIRVTWLDIVVPVAMGGLWLAYFFHNLASMPLLPAFDPYVREVWEPTHSEAGA